MKKFLPSGVMYTWSSTGANMADMFPNLIILFTALVSSSLDLDCKHFSNKVDDSLGQETNPANVLALSLALCCIAHGANMDPDIIMAPETIQDQCISLITAIECLP